MNGNEHLWRQFEKLGEMMGDGLHHEADGKWISVEYKKLAKILCPEGFAEIRKQKSEALNKAIKKWKILKSSEEHKLQKCDQ